MNAIHRLSNDMFLVETPGNEGLRTISLHLMRGGRHVWLWLKLVAGAGPRSAFPQFQRPLPSLEDHGIHANAKMPEGPMLHARQRQIQIGSELFEVDGDTVTAHGFAETDQVLTACLNPQAPFFRWENER